jgi:hypothetical protein
MRQIDAPSAENVMGEGEPSSSVVYLQVADM